LVAAAVVLMETPRPATTEAVGCLERAIGMLTDEGRFSMAAKYHKDIAEICENDLSDNKQAAAHYERAAELYEGEPNSSSYDTLAWAFAFMPFIPHPAVPGLWKRVCATTSFPQLTITAFRICRSVKPCLVKVAHFAAEGGDYVRGKELFEKLAAICLESRLGSYGIPSVIVMVSSL
jgi:hypothetical protein